jgi:diketogulonate reductase-like aldo/keto reductase
MTTATTRALADGRSIPLLALGVWQIPHGSECVSAVRGALELGYRHIDTAQAYGNEESVGRALQDSEIPREQIFVTTKFYPGSADPVQEAELSLKRLGLDHVDLYLVHWPQGGPTRAWPGMEQAHARGYARSIGVSNYGADDLARVRETATVQPTVNQVQFSPFEFRSGLLRACSNAAVALEAYSPLGTGRHLEDPAVRRVAEDVGRSPAQVLLRWCVQQEVPVITKSTHRERIEQNAAIFDFELSDAHMSAFASLDQTGRTSEAREGKWW